MLRPPIPTRRERILAMGSYGTGKTSSWLSIAQWSMLTGSDSRFYVVDTDLSVNHMIENHPARDRIQVWDAFEWEQYEGAIEQILPMLRHNDWLVVDFIGQAWEAVQDWYVGKVYKTSIEDFFMSAREQIKQGSPLDGWKDWCVPFDTQILTDRGWRKGDEIRPGDLALSFTPNGSTWQPITHVYLASPGPRPLVELTGASHSSVSSLGHRWLVQPAGRYGYRWETTATLRTSRIPHAGPRLDLPVVAKFDDAMVELVAWYITEGWRSERVSRVQLQGGIGQSERVNPGNVNRIRSALHSLYGSEGWGEAERDDGVVIFRLNGKVMEDLEAAAPCKVPTPEFILSLTRAQLNLFISTLIDGDGTRSAAGQESMVQVDSERVAAIELAAAQAGIPTRTHRRSGKGSFGGERFEIQFLRTGGVWPQWFERTEFESDEPVWCPVVPSTQTWLARRDGKVFFTGNSVINRVYKSWVNKVIFTNPAQLFVTAQAEPLRDTDDRVMKATFQRVGARPRGQKSLGHQVHTILHFTAIRPGDLYLTTVKDRERQGLEGAKLNDFSVDYLVGVAGWEM
jgi:hypothetical protein